MATIFMRGDAALPEREKNDFYPTPYNVAFRSMRLFKLLYAEKYRKFLDPGCGTGVWGEAVKEVLPCADEILGVEFRDCRKSKSYTRWVTSDFMSFEDDLRGYVTIGNPPFKHGIDFVRHAYMLMGGEGIVAFLLPADFLYSRLRMHELFSDFPLKYVVPYAKRIPFTDKSNPNNYSLYIFDTSYRAQNPQIIWLNQDESCALIEGKMVAL